MAQAMSYASTPAMGADQSYFRKKKQGWDQFMSSLDWESKTKQKDIREVRSILAGAGIPVKVRKKGDSS